MPPPFFLELHALDRMRERGITRAEVKEALERVDVTYGSSDAVDRTVILGRTASDRPLKIVVDSNDHEHVITVARRDDER